MGKNKLSAKILESPLSILKSKAILSVLKKHWLGNHKKLAQPEKFVEDFFEFALRPKIQIQELKKYYKKKIREHWNADLPVEKPSDIFLAFIQKDLIGVEVILDLGCGKLAYLKNIAEQNKFIKKMIGVDSKSRPVLEDLDQRIEFTRKLELVADKSVDLVIIKFVLHHLSEDQEAKDIFF